MSDSKSSSVDASTNGDTDTSTSSPRAWMKKQLRRVYRLVNQPASGHEASASDKLPGAVERCPDGSDRVDNLGPGQRGLVNLGNTCYMNSALQCLSSIEPLKEYFTGECQYLNDVDKHSKSGTAGALAKSFSGLLEKIWSVNLSTQYIPSQDLKCIQKITGGRACKFSKFTQSDSQEFLMHFLEGLHDDLKHTDEELTDSNNTIEEVTEAIQVNYTQSEKSIVSDLFQGMLETTLTCGNEDCSKVFTTYDAFMFLPLPLPDVAMPKNMLEYQELTGEPCSLQDCLSLMTEESITQKKAWFCEGCSRSVKLKRRVNILQAPEILVLSLKRFHASWDHKKKVITQVTFPEILDLGSFSRRPCIYDLFAIINHHGSLYGGHYVAITQINGKWYSFDDDKVYSVKKFSYDNPATYVLFYKKRYQVPANEMSSPPSCNVKDPDVDSFDHEGQDNLVLNLDKNDSLAT